MSTSNSDVVVLDSPTGSGSIVHVDLEEKSMNDSGFSKDDPPVIVGMGKPHLPSLTPGQNFRI